MSGVLMGAALFAAVLNVRDSDVEAVVPAENARNLSVGDSKHKRVKRSCRVGGYDSAWRNADLGRNIRKGFDFLNRKDLKELPVGRYPIDGGKVYAMIQEVDLAPVAERKVEAHRKYIDLQAPLDGEETYGVAALDGTEPAVGGFDEAHDIGFYRIPVVARRVKPGEVIVFPPVIGAHAPCCRAADEPPRKLRKVVIKVLFEP